ncbi:TM2 domain-containing protein [Corynebacterium variabile]|uniref:TM2 domain-containing protein n=1 Tax=Corynebacterium variabile TaxID=1727 RepID=UPI003A930E35
MPTFMPPSAPGPQGQQLSTKSRTIAVVLTWFLGGFGAGNFYRGYVGRGFAQLGLSVASWILLVIGFIQLWAPFLGSGSTSSWSGDGYYYEETTWSTGDGSLMLVAGAMSFALGFWLMYEFFMIIGRNGSFAYDAQGRHLR